MTASQRQRKELEINKLRAFIRMQGSNLHLDLIDLALDALGVPADNTCETNACEIANATGVWPENAFCRDHWYEQWYDIKRGESKLTIKVFPSWAREQFQQARPVECLDVCREKGGQQ